MPSAGAQRLAVKALLSLPPPILRLMSGGGVVYKGGRTLDPQLQFLAHQARRNPPMDTLPPEEARRAEAASVVLLSSPSPPGVRWERTTVPGGDGERPARLYHPENPDPHAPLMVWAHMGGGVIGTLDTTHGFCGLLAKVTRGPVISVDYRLAPEHRFPAGLEDVLAAYRWALDKAGTFGAHGVAVGGDSMGGNFAAVLCQELRRAGEPQPVMQLLVYPCTDAVSQSESMTVYGDAFPLTRRLMDWFLGHYLGPDDDLAAVRLSPLREKDLSGLAPAVIVTAGFDPLLDQGEAYAKALKAAGVTVRYRCYDSLSHAFCAFTGAIPVADAACREIAGLAREAYQEAAAG